MQALSLRIPQTVLQQKVMMRFWRGMGMSGMMLEWSVRLLTEQVTTQTKYIHLNLQEVKNSMGLVTSLRRPFLTPSLTVCLPLAYSMTERSRMALVGDTAKAVTNPAMMSLRDQKFELGWPIDSPCCQNQEFYLIKLNLALINSKDNFHILNTLKPIQIYRAHRSRSNYSAILFTLLYSTDYLLFVEFWWSIKFSIKLKKISLSSQKKR